MRLINADALKAEFTGNFREEYPASLIKAIIDNAPTFDPIKHGEWIKVDRFSYVKCSVCESEEDNAFYLFAYCPRCAFKMDGELNAKKET